ncbi:MAG: hypothetical protein KBI47_13870 [Armatimonadetes bacterium]|jgi:flagellar basal-body rod protein FlgB|nr:hypothetical protein [Armatimonadota bacterium]
MFRDISNAAVEKAIIGLTRRHEAIASNLANLETPGYRPRRVHFEDALQRAVERETELSDGGAGLQEIEAVQPRNRMQPGAGGSPGNMSVERELTDLAITNLHHEALTRILARQYGMLRTAITGGGRG